VSDFDTRTYEQRPKQPQIRPLHIQLIESGDDARVDDRALDRPRIVTIMTRVSV
jgi:hypothetical protein